MNEAFSAGGEPNPNLFFISCPYIRRQLGRLEDHGLITRLQERVSRDEELAADLRMAQEEHRRRWLLAARRAPAAAAPGGMRAAPLIASARDPLLIKCLHAHFAWFLTNPEYKLGMLIEERLGEGWCADDQCRRFRQAGE